MEAIDTDLRMNCYLPFSHAEDAGVQDSPVNAHAGLGQPWLAHAEGIRFAQASKNPDPLSPHPIEKAAAVAAARAAGARGPERGTGISA